MDHQVHQSLHRRFQNSTPWGMLARVQVDVAAAGVDSQRLRAIARSATGTPRRCTKPTRPICRSPAILTTPWWPVNSTHIGGSSKMADRSPRIDRGLTARLVVDAVARAAMSPAVLGRTDVGTV